MVNLLIGISGSVASIKIEALEQTFNGLYNIKFVVTENSKHFISGVEDRDNLYQDKDEWDTWSKMGDPVLHIYLAKWANNSYS